MQVMVWKTALLMKTTPHVVYHMPMDDILGIWKTKEGKYDKMTYGYEIDNLNKLKEKFNGR